MFSGHVCALVFEGCFLCCNWLLRRIDCSQRDEIGPGGGSVHLQGVTSDHSLLHHLFLVNHVRTEIIKDAIITALSRVQTTTDMHNGEVLV